MTAPSPERTEEQIGHLLDQFADGFSQQSRSPVLHSPAEHGLDFEDVTFPSRDGVPLEGWFIPAPASIKLVIANHPMGFTRSCLPKHLEPWRSVWAASGNAFEVDLVPDCKILHDAGYNVLAYDLRNHGLSGAANGGLTSNGIFEARDVVGALDYARSRPDTREQSARSCFDVQDAQSFRQPLLPDRPCSLSSPRAICELLVRSQRVLQLPASTQLDSRRRNEHPGVRRVEPGHRGDAETTGCGGLSGADQISVSRRIHAVAGIQLRQRVLSHVPSVKSFTGQTQEPQHDHLPTAHHNSFRCIEHRR
jgi:hypothetical protein